MIISFVIYLFIIIFFTSYFFLINQSLVVNRKGRVLFRNSLFICLVLLLFLLSIFTSLRSINTGTDTYGIYYQYFYDWYIIKKIPYFGYEYGFYFLVKIAGCFSNSYTNLLFVVGLFVTFFSFIGIINSRAFVNVGYVAFLFFCFLFFNSFNIQRQMCAVSIVFAGLHFLYEKKPICFLLSVFVATLFHTSALCCLIMLVYYLICEYKLTKIRNIIVFGTIALPALLPFIFKSLSYVSFFDKYVQLYSGLNFEISISNLALVIYNLPFYLFVYFYRKKLVSKNSFNSILILMLIMNFTCNFFKVAMVWISRLADYFVIANFLLIPQCRNFIKNKGFFDLFLFFYGFGYFIIYYGVLLNHNIIPYF